MITDTNRAMKFCVWHPLLKPKLALLDPELTLGLPKNLTAWTGIDALVHARIYCVQVRIRCVTELLYMRSKLSGLGFHRSERTQ